MGHCWKVIRNGKLLPKPRVARERIDSSPEMNQIGISPFHTRGLKKKESFISNIQKDLIRANYRIKDRPPKLLIPPPKCTLTWILVRKRLPSSTGCTAIYIYLYEMWSWPLVSALRGARHFTSPIRIHVEVLSSDLPFNRPKPFIDTSPEIGCGFGYQTLHDNFRSGLTLHIHSNRKYSKCFTCSSSRIGPNSLTLF